MRKIDKLKNIQRANMLSEQRYLNTKNLLNVNDVAHGYITEKLSWKDALLGAAMGASVLNPSDAKPQPSYQTTISQTQSNTLSTIKGPIGMQLISDLDLDLVHGVLGSKRLNDDFERRVSDELKRLNQLGYKTDVSNIRINTYVMNDKIITESSCDIIESKDGNSYNIFTTRGSIGDGFEERHDKQVVGLADRLSNHFGGPAKGVKTVTINFPLNGQNISYKQSFFVASDKQDVAVNNKSETFEIIGRDFSDLREKLKQQTINQSIDPNSLKIDINQMKVSFNKGNTKINNLSIIFDNVGELDNRLVTIKQKNAGLTIVEKGSHKGVQWALVIL